MANATGPLCRSACLTTNCQNRTGAKTDNLEQHGLSKDDRCCCQIAGMIEEGGRAPPRVFIRLPIIHPGTVGCADAAQERSLEKSDNGAEMRRETRQRRPC